MTEAATKQTGQVVDGKFRLGQFVGGNERSSVFLVDYDGQQVPRAAIKLIPAESVDAPAQLARWKHAAKLSHPHLIRLLEMGRCELDHKAMLYVAMEYAEENLSQVVARRPLSPAEARDILGPVADALAYVHAQGFVHCRLKPANVMADDDLLKISSDGLCRIGESSGSPMKSDAYDPPEAAGGRISPAGDVWSLGMTMVESLTQRLPVWERTNQSEPAVPSNLPPEFLDLARHCLRRDPQLRWTVADIAKRLQQDPAAPPKQITPIPQTPLLNPLTIGAAVLAVLVLLAIIAGPRVFKRAAQNRPAVSVAIEQPSAQPQALPPAHSSGQPTAPAKGQPKPGKNPPLSAKSPAPVPVTPQKTLPVPKPAPPAEPSLAAKHAQQTAPQPVAQTRQGTPSYPARPDQGTNSRTLSAPNENSLALRQGTASAVPKTTAASGVLTPEGSKSAVTPSSGGIVPGKVLQQVLPDAPQKARATIRGTVRVSVKVHVDESGSVTAASFDSPGPSQYFADRTLKAAQLWKFSPAKIDGRNAPSEWLLRFEIDPATINAFPKQTSP